MILRLIFKVDSLPAYLMGSKIVIQSVSLDPNPSVFAYSTLSISIVFKLLFASSIVKCTAKYDG